MPCHPLEDDSQGVVACFAFSMLLVAINYALARITSEPGKLGGRRCLRGLRIRVSDVLVLLAAGLSHAEVLAELPDLEADDIRAALLFAAQRLDHPVIAAA